MLDRVREAIRTRHYIVFHGQRHPTEMGAPEVTHFLTSLAVDAKVAVVTQNQALSALVFPCRHVLNLEPNAVRSPADRMFSP